MASYYGAGNIRQAVSGGGGGSSGEAKVRVVRNAANGAAMYGRGLHSSTFGST